MGAQDNYLASNLRHLRELENISKNQLSLILKTSNTHIGQLERNEIANPSYKIIESLADYFGVVNLRHLVRKDLSDTQDDLERQLIKLILNSNGIHEKSCVASLSVMVTNFMRTLEQIGHFDIHNR